MASIDTLIGYNRSASSVNKLLAVYGNDVVDVDAATGFGLNISSPSTANFEVFLDHVFYQDYSRKPITYNGTAWGATNVSRTPIAKYLKRLKDKLYLGYCNFTSPQAPTGAGPFPSRVFFPNLPKNEKIAWGIEWGTNLKITNGSPIVSVSSMIQNFIANGIKKGDPIYLTSGLTNTLQSYVLSVDSPYQLTLTENMTETATSVHFWVGGNWLDFGTDDNDYITSLGENDDRLLVFKQFSLWRYNQISKQRVKDAVGTTSSKSIVNIGRYTYYWHGSNTNTRKTGWYRYDGVESRLISRAIQRYIDGVPTGNYTSVVGWREGNKLRGFVGNLTNTPYDVSVTNAVMTLDTEGGQWSIDPIADVVKSTGRFLESSVEKTFIGTNDDEVLETPSGNTHNTSSIPWAMQTGPRYPAGTEVINEFTRIKVHSISGGRGIQVAYKLYGTPEDDDDVWTNLGDLEHNHQEFQVPARHNNGSGINIKLFDLEGNANTFTIQKITVFYKSFGLRDVL